MVSEPSPEPVLFCSPGVGELESIDLDGASFLRRPHSLLSISVHICGTVERSRQAGEKLCSADRDSVLIPSQDTVPAHCPLCSGSSCYTHCLFFTCLLDRALFHPGSPRDLELTSQPYEEDKAWWSGFLRGLQYSDKIWRSFFWG
jgi:hypothetical protein